jgi:hypothetical protein
MDPNDAPPPSSAAWLAARAAACERELTRAGQIIAAGGRSNDASLNARQYLERALGADPSVVFTIADYRYAANQLPGGGRDWHRDVLESVAEIDGELRAAAPAWAGRYDRRPPTAEERHAEARLRAGEVVESGHAAHGVDGAWYTRAYYPRSGTPAVVVTTSALTEAVVNFANKPDAQAWLVSRAPEAAGPLRTTETGPITRTAREEELLAFLIREPGAGADAAALAGNATFTTHLRAELFAAWRWLTAQGGAPGYGVIANAFGRRLLRAPGTMAEDIGWPGATRAMAYLQRLAATPVTEAQARVSAEALAEADVAAAAGAPRLRPAAGVTVAAAVPLSRVTTPAALSAGPLQADQRPLVQRPPVPAPVFGSPAPRP